MTGEADFALAADSIAPLDLAAAGAPVKAVMATFQKDPQALLAHPDASLTGLSDLKTRPVYLTEAAIGASWVWLKVRYGLTDDQLRRNTRGSYPVATDREAVQDGHIIREPYALEQRTGIKPQVLLLADYGYPSYGALVLAGATLIAEEPQTVQAFVDASIEGWISYIEDDPTNAHALIKRDASTMTDEILEQSRRHIIDYDLIGLDATLESGVGHMSHARWAKFFAMLASNGIYERTLPLEEAYTLEFLNATPR